MTILLDKFQVQQLLKFSCLNIGKILFKKIITHPAESSTSGPMHVPLLQSV